MTEKEDRKRELLANEAAEWHLRANEGSMSSSERLKQVAWLKASPEHVAEALRMDAMDVLLHSVKLEADDYAEATVTPKLDRWSRWKLGAALAAFVLTIALVAVVLIAGADRKQDRALDDRGMSEQRQAADQ